MISKSMTIQEILESKPSSVEVLNRYGLSCGACELGPVETLEEGAKGHGLTHDELKNLLSDLNSGII